MNEIVKYDKEQDILYVHKGDKEADSLPIEDFIVEFSHNNKVVGMEILNASENPDKYGIREEIELKYREISETPYDEPSEGEIFVGRKRELFNIFGVGLKTSDWDFTLSLDLKDGGVKIKQASEGNEILKDRALKDILEETFEK